MSTHQIGYNVEANDATNTPTGYKKKLLCILLNFLERQIDSQSGQKMAYETQEKISFGFFCG